MTGLLRTKGLLTVIFLLSWLSAGCPPSGDDDDATSATPVQTGDLDGDGYTIEDGDCNDEDGGINPGADEWCDGVDNDCDGDVDENDAVDASEWYLDMDGDGYGSNMIPVLACDAPENHVDNGDDCDDDNPDINPGVQEVCDEARIDQDCDGLADDDDPDVDPATQLLFYVDQDGDQDGDAGAPSEAFCHKPEGYAETNTDCDDADPTRNGMATEVCDGADVDEDCDGLADDQDPDTDETTKTTFYPDADQDGFGDAAGDPVAACNLSLGLADNNTDCNDSDPDVNPAQDEICDDADTDEDCNGLADDADSHTLENSKYLFYVDADGDGFGDAIDDGTEACDPGDGRVKNNRDCDDDNPDINPAADEVCDDLGVDENCNGLANDDDPTTTAESRTLYYHDVDMDKYGNPNDSRLFCDDPSTGTDWWTDTDGTDCDDRSANVNPDSAEFCNDVDDDCDGQVDEEAADATTWYRDADLDGYGVASDTTEACSRPAGFVAQSGDCNDDNVAVHPGADEICDPDDIDEDCDGVADDADPSTDDTTKTRYYPDADDDGFGDEESAGVLFCDPPEGYLLDHSDCNDSSADFNPAAAETDCADNNDYNCDGSVGAVDADGDGFFACEECDDENPQVNPGSVEICDPDDIDEDCDGVADDDDPSTAPSSKTLYYVDTDGDGYGDADDQGVAACEPIEGLVTTHTDCDDADPAIHPAATEICDPNDVDENCNGLADENDPTTAAGSKIAFYHDVDQDGFGATANPTYHCEDPTSSTDWWTTDNSDCNDRNADIHPAAVESCNGVDDNCNGTTDETPAQDAPTWYLDQDGDGYGTTSDKKDACTRPGGYVAASGDCDDTDPAVNPDATEVCDPDGADEDCNGLANDDDPGTDEATKTRFYPDTDSDGYGDENAEGTSFCNAPEGYVLDNTDCNDSDRAYNPGASEDDCTDPNDYNCDGSTGYSDGDGDGYPACTDCDDEDPTINPGATETCDPADVDENCNGLADDEDPDVEPASKSRFYQDQDGDGYGDANDNGSLLCDTTEGYVRDHTDCDDTRADINPDAPEVCDDRDTDENCNGAADNDDPSAIAASQTTFYHDADTDGFGDPSASASFCDDPTTSTDWWTLDGTDCNDRDPDINPDQIERCNGTDDDCDGEADEADASDAQTYYADLDGDGYGNPSNKLAACKAPEGYTADGGDCDDGNAAVNPQALEVCDVLDVDENCNGLADDDDPSTKQSTKARYYADFDGDGYGRETDPGTLFCDPPEGYAPLGGDCEDTNAAFNPGAAEDDCSDPNDYNCDGVVGYEDSDGDGFAACEECDDHDPDIRPDADEICDGIDNDCDGLIDDDDDSIADTSRATYYLDGDGDGYGDDGSAALFCSNPTSAEQAWVAAPGDCDDADSAVNPGAEETCNGVDDDCDGTVDGETAADAQLYYADTDLDGFGDPFAARRACTAPDGTVANHDDCDDSDPETNPDAQEDCADLGVDRNCNNLVGCADPACVTTAACQDAEVCDNGADDDGDGYADCNDVDCIDHPACTAPGCPDADLGGDMGAPLLWAATDGAGNDLEGSCGGGDAEDLAFSWTAPMTATYLVDTTGSAVDTVLYALDGACDGPELDCNDDHYIGESLDTSSQIVLDLEAGQTVVLVLDGYATSAGDVALNILPTEAYDCFDGVDNDQDGAVDCDDPDCASQTDCSTEVCDDHTDNDGDGTIDCLDDDCAADAACQAITCPDVDVGNDLPAYVAGYTIEGSDNFTGACGGNGAPDYAFSWTAPTDGQFTISTQGSEFDTVLYVLLDGCSSGYPLACNDDVSIDEGLTHSEVTVSLFAGESIVVFVDGFGAQDFGYFLVTITASESGFCNDGVDNDGDGLTDCLDNDCSSDSNCAVEVCDNGIDDDGDGLADCVDDDCSGASGCETVSCPDLELGTATGVPVAVGSTVGVSNDFASALCNGKGGTASDVTVSWVAPNDGLFYIDTEGSGFDTVLYVLAGSCDGPELTCNDDVGGTFQSAVELEAVAGETFIIVVDGYGGDAGDVQLNIRQAESQACSDGVDNDADGLTDCDDDDCATDTACIPEDCSNGIDDDMDGAIDCVDPECADAAECAGFSCPDVDLGDALGYAVATGSTVGAGNELQATCDGTTYGASAEDVALAWTAPWEGHFTFSTDDSDFDTVAYLLTDSCSGEVVTCDDDSGTNNQARLDVYVPAGQTLVVVVDGYASEAGNYVLSVYPHETFFCTDGIDNDADGLTDCDDEDCAATSECIPEVCDNGVDDDGDGLIDCVDDECASDAACAGFSCPELDLGSVTGDNVASGTTDDADDTFQLSCNTGTAPDVAARWTAPVDGYYTIDTFGSGFDTVIAVLEETCSGAEVACNDQGMNGMSNQSEITSYFQAGQPVVIVIDGWDGDSGAFVLNINPATESTPTPVPALDTSCADQDLGSAIGTDVVNGSTAQADHSFDELCFGEQAGDLAYAWVAPANATYTFRLQGTDFSPSLTIYRLYPGDTCPGTMVYFCDYQADPSTPLETSVALGKDESFIIVVSGMDGGWGDFALDIFQSEAAFCGDGVDNDQDGVVDCEDSDCALDLDCAAEDCSDGTDNDYDYAVDCRDPDCAGQAGCEAEPCADVDLGSAMGDPVFTETITGAGNDYEGICMGETGDDLFLLWTAPADGDYILHTAGSDFLVGLSLFVPNPAADSCMGDLLWCDEQPSTESPIAVSLSLVAGQQIGILVDDPWATGGNLSLSIYEDPTVEVVFEVEVPLDTPETDTVFLSGSVDELGAWDPAAVPLTYLGDNLWTVTVTFPRDTYFEYKYTRGTWETVETDASGNDIANRFGLADVDQTFLDLVERWADSSGQIAVDHLVINEVDYEQPGTDVAEFVELYNPSRSVIDLTDLELVLVNGGYSPPSDYDRIPLAEVGSLNPGEYLVVAAETVSVDPQAHVIRFAAPDGNLQNGGTSPDGLAIMSVSTGEVIDALSYEGELRNAVIDGATVDLVEGQPTTAEDTGDGSLARYPNGTDTNNAAADWILTSTITPGSANR